MSVTTVEAVPGPDPEVRPARQVALAVVGSGFMLWIVLVVARRSGAAAPIRVNDLEDAGAEVSGYLQAVPDLGTAC